MIYIVLEYFIFLNLFVAVLVDNFQLTLQAQSEANRKEKERHVDESDEDEAEFHKHFAEENNSEDDSFNDNDPFMRKRLMATHCRDMDQKDTKALKHYLGLLTALEYNQQVLTNQHSVLNMMVDMCVDNPDDM